MATIKAGYRITVDSYENDGDSSNTNSIDGLSELEAKFHVELLSLYTRKGGFGNIYEFDDRVSPTEDDHSKACLAIVSKPEYQQFISDWYVKNPEYFAEAGDDIVFDYTGGDGEWATRLVESILVEYVPEEITLEDVTSQFLK